MHSLQRKILSGLSYLRRGEFFLLVQTLAALLLPGWLCRMKKSIIYRLDPKAEHTLQKTGDIEVFRGTESSVPEIVSDLYANSPQELAFYEQYYREGIEPWIARSHGKIVGVIWLYTGSYLAMWEGYDAWLLNVHVESSGKFFANVFTDPAARGKGVFSHLAEQCFAAYPESPFYTCIEVSNTASIRSHEKVGFRRNGTIYYIRFFQKTFCFFRPKKGLQKGGTRFLLLKRGQAVDIDFTGFPAPFVRPNRSHTNDSPAVNCISIETAPKDKSTYSG
jgi:GNAT superfamily N-acetyltransferase